MHYDFQYVDSQFTQYKQSKKPVAQYDESFVEQIKQIDGVSDVVVNKATFSNISFDLDTLRCDVL